MRKWIVVTLMSIFLLSACSSGQQYATAYEAILSLEENVNEVNSPAYVIIDGVQPKSYDLTGGEVVRVYDFGTDAKRDEGKKRFEDSIALSSTHAPLIYEAGNYLVLYYSNAVSESRTPKVNETKYGEKIENVLNSIL